jgi:hypothetical protein
LTIQKQLIMIREKLNMFVIVKEIKNKKTGNVLPVILLDGHDQVLEFGDELKASELTIILNKNSDSGHKYLVKKL